MAHSSRNVSVSPMIVAYSISSSFFRAAPEECREWALPENEGFDPLESLDLDSAGVNFDTYNAGSANLSATTSLSPPLAPSLPRDTPSSVDPNLAVSPTPDPVRLASPPSGHPPSRGPSPAPTPPHSPRRVVPSAPGSASASDGDDLPRHVVPSPQRFDSFSPDSELVHRALRPSPDSEFGHRALRPTFARPHSSPLRFPTVALLSPAKSSARAAMTGKLTSSPS